MTLIQILKSECNIHAFNSNQIRCKFRIFLIKLLLMIIKREYSILYRSTFHAMQSFLNYVYDNLDSDNYVFFHVFRLSKGI